MTLDEEIRDLLDRHRGFRKTPSLRLSLSAEISRLIPKWATRYGLTRGAVEVAISKAMNPRAKA